MTIALQSTAALPIESGAVSSSIVAGQSSNLDFLPHGISIFDRDQTLLLSNEKFRTIYNLSEDAVRSGANLKSLLLQIERVDVRTLLMDVIDCKLGFDHVAQIWNTADDRSISVCCEANDDGGFVVLHEDVTKLCRDRNNLTKLASEDPLTGLLNRTAFSLQFEARIKALGENAEMAMLFIDLDHFKPVNDIFGHPAGDTILKEVAHRISGIVRADDLVARLGGDEFAVLQSGGMQPSGSRALARRIIETLSAPFHFDGQLVNIGASIGVAIGPYDADTAEELIKNADLALYRAKSEGRNLLRYYEPEMDAMVQSRRNLESQLRQALAENQFVMHYQPVVDVHSKKVIAFEGLVRWQHPQLGRIAPDKFIPLAEETGLILPLGEWVLRQACRDAATWDESIRVAVNLSSVQLRDRTFVLTVMSALQQAGLPAERLELEITETSLMDNTDLTLSLLHQLRDMGVTIAMDDFGTGYSSINYLRRFPFDKIKIDRSFVSQSSSEESIALIRMIASLGVSLGVRTTAEGVETDAEFNTVRDAGCTEVQGFLLSKPVPAEEVFETLNTLLNSHSQFRKGN